jgi:ribose/xylose/arabinose/galactoside ABC-type transport system permease subunit
MMRISNLSRNLLNIAQSQTFPMKRIAIILGSTVLTAGIILSVFAVMKLAEVHGWEVVAERDQAFTPAIPSAHNFWQNILILSAITSAVGSGIIAIGFFKGKLMRINK